MEYKSDIKQKDNIQEVLANANAERRFRAMVEVVRGFYDRVEKCDSIEMEDLADLEDKIFDILSEIDKEHNYEGDGDSPFVEEFYKSLEQELGTDRVNNIRHINNSYDDGNYCDGSMVVLNGFIGSITEGEWDLIELQERIDKLKQNFGFDIMKIKEIRETVEKFKDLFKKYGNIAPNEEGTKSLKELKKIDEIIQGNFKGGSIHDIVKNFQLRENDFKRLMKDKAIKEKVKEKLKKKDFKSDSLRYLSFLDSIKTKDFFSSNDKIYVNKEVSEVLSDAYNRIANDYDIPVEDISKEMQLKDWKNKFKNLKNVEYIKGMDDDVNSVLEKIESLEHEFVDASNMGFDKVGEEAHYEKGNLSLKDTWKEAGASKFWGKDGPNLKDIKQGAIGDCYLLSSIRCLLLKDPKIIKNIFPNLDEEVNRDGTLKGDTVTVRLYKVEKKEIRDKNKPKLFKDNTSVQHVRMAGGYVDIKVNKNILSQAFKKDESLGTGWSKVKDDKKLSNKSEYIWVNMIEKAIAVARSLDMGLHSSSLWNKREKDGHGNPKSKEIEWKNLSSGNALCMSILSGMESITYDDKRYDTDEDALKLGTSKADEEKIMEYLKEKEDDCSIYCAMSPRFEPEKENSTGRHAYAFVGFDKNGDIILRNPWYEEQETKIPVKTFMSYLIGLAKLRVKENRISFPGIKF